MTPGTIVVDIVEDGLSTWQLTFTPALELGDLPSDEDVVTFLPQRVFIKVGDDGAIDWTENFEPIFDSDRGEPDGVRAGLAVPMDVNLTFVYDWLRASSGQAIKPYEAIHRIGGAAGWHNAADDPCEPYCVDFFVIDTPPCGSEDTEVYVFESFYPTSINPSFGDAQVTMSARCPASRPTITREPV
jgi:hypothetical protein